MRRIIHGVGVLTAASLVGAAAADAEVTGNIAMASNYVSRGVSYSDNDPALQGGMDFSHPSGVYVGAWGSRVDFGTPAHMELDVYGGMTRPMAGGFAWDLGVAYYSYPGDSTTNYREVYAGLTYKVFTAKLWYANDYAGTGGDERYWDGEIKWTLPFSFGLNLHVGYSEFAPTIGIKDYADYRASVSRDYEGLAFDLGYADTNQRQFGPWDDGKIVATVSKQF